MQRKRVGFRLVTDYDFDHILGTDFSSENDRLTVYNGLSQMCTLLGVQSWVRFCQQEFGEFPRLVGRYCSYILPKFLLTTPLPHDWTNKSVVH